MDDRSEVIPATLLCRFCDTPLTESTDVCQRCGIGSGSDSANPYQSPTIPVAIAQGTNSSTTFVSMVLTGVLIVVLLVICLVSPGLAIFLALLTIPPWVRTALVMRRRSTSGLDTTVASSAAMYLGSMLVTWLILFVALVSCFLTFCFACIGALALSKEESVVFPMIGIAVLSVLCVLALAFTPWVRSRYKRDTTKK